MKNKNNISVIIRTKNEERWIGHCIQSLIDNLQKPEIIIIDNKSTDNTIEIVKSFIQDPLLENSLNHNYTKIKIKQIDDYSPGKSLNLGVKNSTCKYLLIISAHCVLNKINLEKLIKQLNKFCSVFGNQIPIWNGKKITKRYIWSHFINKKVENMYSKLENRYFFHNALAFYLKDTLKKNPFDENLISKEDRYWVNSMIKKNKKTLYDPSLEAYHHYTPEGKTWKGIG